MIAFQGGQDGHLPQTADGRFRMSLASNAPFSIGYLLLEVTGYWLGSERNWQRRSMMIIANTQELP
jgi:hypothetical protein